MTKPESDGAIADTDNVKAQYQDSSKLERRAAIHKYGTAPIGWFDWVAEQARLADGAEILEVGCGPGWLWGAPAFPSSLALTLTDLSEGMASEALARVRALGRYRSFEGQAADVVALPFADSSFDAVLACHMMYHVPNAGRALDEMIRVLRPGGALIVTTNGEDNMGAMYKLARAAWNAPEVDPSGISFGLDAAVAALETRLQSVSVATYRDILKVTDGEAIVGALTSYPPGENASETQLQTLRSLIAKTMAEHGGMFPMNKRQGLVRGLKA